MFRDIFIVGCAFAAFCLVMVGVIIYFQAQERAAVKKRAAEIISPHLKLLEERTRSSARMLESFAKLFGTIRERMGNRGGARIRERLKLAGNYDPRAFNIFFGLRILIPAMLVVMVSFLSLNFTSLISAGVVGYLIPEFILDRMAKRRQIRIQRSIPDTVDLMVICMKAGVGLDQAIQRSAETMVIAHPELSRELLATVHLQRMGVTRAQAWQRMVDRLRSRQMEQIGSLFNQADTFGAPIVDALVAVGDSLRMQRKHRAEESAARKSIQLLVPLAFFIFPVIMIVLMGPALISIAHGFGNFGH